MLLKKGSVVEECEHWGELVNVNWLRACLFEGCEWSSVLWRLRGFILLLGQDQKQVPKKSQGLEIIVRHSGIKPCGLWKDTEDQCWGTAIAATKENNRGWWRNFQ